MLLAIFSNQILSLDYNLNPMKTKTIYAILFALIIFAVHSCKISPSGDAEKSTLVLIESEELSEDEHSYALYAMNASQYGTTYRETMILLQNRKGLRIEYCVDRSALEIWLSPQAGKSISYIDRNWSNRDDHTAIFDRITIPGLDLQQFDSCDWDPFHSIIYFKDQTLHISQVYDQPAVLVWLEDGGNVDFKMIGDPVERSEHAFIMDFSDRGREFQSAAVIGPGKGAFRHQLQIAPHRSVYARAELAPNQLLVITSELEFEQMGKLAKVIASRDPNAIEAGNELRIATDLDHGEFTLRDKPEMQKLLDKGRRTALSMQDFEGFMRSTNQYIYYLLWYRDGGMNTGHLSYTGWLEPARMQTRLALNNPNISYEEPGGRFFGMLPTGAITKWEEDGLFYVVWPAFNYWTMTGDKTYCQGEYLELMEEAMTWMEDYLWDEEKSLFFRTHYCETPYTGTRGDGYDNATGAPTNFNISQYEGNTVVGAYDIYINLLHYSVYLMLASMEDDNRAAVYIQKAKQVEKGLQQAFSYDEVLPSYGEVVTENGETIMTRPYGMDIWDYVWAMSLPPFTPTLPEKYEQWREQLYTDMTNTNSGYFLCVYFALLTSMDTEIHSEARIMDAMDALVATSIAPGKYLPMPYAMPEMFNISEENPFHDVRPLVYSIAPWLSSVTNLGIRTLPFGIAVRGADHLESIDEFVYGDGLIDVEFSGSGSIEQWKLNGEIVEHTYQLPENKIVAGNNSIEVTSAPGAEGTNTLISSTLRLESVIEENAQVTYVVRAFGKNTATFKHLDRELVVMDELGNSVEAELIRNGNLTWVEFSGRGTYFLVMQ